MAPGRVVVIGAGVGGLAAAMLAGRARLRRRWSWSEPPAPGGKMREIEVGGARDRRRPDRVHDARRVRRFVRRRRRLAQRSPEVDTGHGAGAARLGATARVSISTATSTPTPRRSAISPAPAEARGYRAFAARSAGDPRNPANPRSSAPRGRTRLSLTARVGLFDVSRPVVDLAVRYALGARSAHISATRGCDSCLVATPPIAARRRSWRRRR